MFDNFMPLGKYVLVKMSIVENKTSGGLFLSQSSKKENRLATVMAIGADVTRVSIGDTIFLGRTLVEATDDINILIEDDILGVIKNR